MVHLVPYVSQSLTAAGHISENPKRREITVRALTQPERAVPPAPSQDRATGGNEAGTIPLWRRYRRRGDQAARNELLERYLPLVRLLARKLAARIGGAVEVDDLVSAGTIGLVQALESYDLSRANSFATYASRRIHGSMLDELRRRDWVPRSVRSKARQLQRASAQIEATLGRSPRPTEMAAALKVDLTTYWSWRGVVGGAVQVSLDEGPSGDISELAPSFLLDQESSLDGITREEQIESLAQALARLPERERTVLVLYFYEDLNLRQIAELLHLTESRISQIRSAALNRIRGILEREVA
jgi:RNA polymerase sigma factor for flagellar operon FliA